MPPAAPHSYAAARAAFLERIEGAWHTAVDHSLAGPDGALAMDAAFWAGRNDRRVLVISSGTHGIEGYAGSWLQSALLDDGIAHRATGFCSLLMVHAVNPWGFAWQRRVNENNVDLNRNFIDFDAPLPENPGYEEIAGLLEPAHWGADTNDAILGALAEAARRHPDDPRWLQAAVSGGQYRHPHGLFYGGAEPQWSRREVLAIAERHLPGREVVWVDLHTALGDYGTGQCIVDLEPGSREHSRAEALWGERARNIGTAESVAAGVAGAMIDGVARTFADAEVLGTGLEFGTVAQMEVLGALLQDQWLARHGDLTSASGREAQERMRQAFWPDDAGWRDSVFEITREVTEAVVDAWRA